MGQRLTLSGKWADLTGREDSSAAQAEDAKFEDWQGFIIDPAVDAGLGETRRRTAAMPEERFRSNPKIRHRLR